MQNANVNIIGKSIKHKFAKKALDGQYRGAQASCKIWVDGLRKIQQKGDIGEEKKCSINSIRKEVKGLYS